MTGEWLDISAPLASGLPVWPGDPPVRMERTLSLDRGDNCNLTALSMTVHAGTHIDAPLHFLGGGAPMDAFDFDSGIGPARVIAIQDPVSVTAEELTAHSIRRGERILFKTLNSERCWKSPGFTADFVPISVAAARYLAETGIRLAGIDYLSVGAPGEEGDLTHRILLGGGVWILEGLDLSAAAPGLYDLFCLPLRIQGAEGAPARALLRSRQNP